MEQLQGIMVKIRDESTHMNDLVANITDGIKDSNENASNISATMQELSASMEEVAATKIKASGEAYGVRDPKSDVHILDNIKTNKPKKTGNGGYADVTFSGSRPNGSGTVRNAEVAFIQEYGKKNQQARPFVGEGMNKNADAIAKAGAEVILEWTEHNF